MIENGADLNAKDNGGRTCLHYVAMKEGKPKDIRLAGLITNQQNINIQDNDGNTALHFAAEDSSLKMVECLISIGADLSLRNSRGETPAGLAELANRKAIRKVLNHGK